jgi:hypothetical protein
MTQGAELSSTDQFLARLGAAASPVGAIVLILSTLLHPLDSDPNDAPAAFAEYAANSIYVWSHLGQFAGFALLGVALLGLAATLEAGRAAAWARVGVIGVAASISIVAALQAVDGVALKVTVNRWAAATGEARSLAFEVALAVRQIEIGLASFVSLMFVLSIIAFGLAMSYSVLYPAWLAAIALAAGLGALAAGAAQASTGFSNLGTLTSMLSSLALLVWAILVGFFMWRLASRQASPV